MGKYWTVPPEVRERMSEGQKRGWANPEARAHASEAQKERWSREEEREAQRDRRNAWLQTPEGQAHMAKMTEARVHSDEWRAGASERAKAQWADPEYRAKVLAAQARGKSTPEFHEHRSAATRKQFADPEFLARFKAIQKAVFTDPDKRAARLAHLRDISVESPTSIELAVAAVLDALELTYRTEELIGPYRVDFYLPDSRTVLEADGDYWHALPEVRTKDAAENAYLAARGYVVIRLTETDIRADAPAAVLNALAALFEEDEKAV